MGFHCTCTSWILSQPNTRLLGILYNDPVLLLCVKGSHRGSGGEAPAKVPKTIKSGTEALKSLKHFESIQLKLHVLSASSHQISILGIHWVVFQQVVCLIKQTTFCRLYSTSYQELLSAHLVVLLFANEKRHLVAYEVQCLPVSSPSLFTAPVLLFVEFWHRALTTGFKTF